MNGSGEAMVRQLLQEKQELLELILGCAEKQAETVYFEDQVLYDNLVELKEQYFDQIRKKDIMLANFIAQLAPTAELQAEIATINQVMLEMADRIKKLDTANRIRLTQEMQGVKQKIQALHKGKQGTKSYSTANQVKVSGAYMDSRR